MFDVFTIFLVAGTFLIAGAVKGIIGLGLPTISVAILTVAIGLPEAMALLLVPSFVTNLWQAAVGGHGATILRRMWPFLVMATATVWLGAHVLRSADPSLLSALLGVLLVVYSTINLIGYRFALTARQEVWLGPLVGAINGLLTGMTGSFVVPGVMFLQAIGLSRDMLVQAMGILFAVSTLALALALQGNDLLTTELGAWSGVALVPAIAGMVAGKRIRKRLPEHLFRRLFFASLMILGAYIIARAMPGPF